jgi:hypothetical protein
VLAVVEKYRAAIEQLSSECVEEGSTQERANKRTRKALLEMMHSFLELPAIKRCYSQKILGSGRGDGDGNDVDNKASGAGRRSQKPNSGDRFEFDDVCDEQVDETTAT